MDTDKIALGTVQFGLDYGINNTRGRIPKDEAFLILSKASEAGISVLDTAAAYGQSEEVIGEYIAGGNRCFDVISKSSKCTPGQLAESTKRSMNRLHLSRLYGCLLHSFNDFKESPGLWDELLAIKQLNLVGKVGFSLYHIEEIEFLLNHVAGIDLVQVPYSVLDQRFSPYFSTLKEKGIEVHVRSVFLQGLLFKESDKLQGHFLKAKDALSKLHAIARKTGIPCSALCVNFAALNKYVDKVVIGVDSLANMDDLLHVPRYGGAVQGVYHQLECLRLDDLDIILPTRWSAQN